jgi:hypothetical protein
MPQRNRSHYPWKTGLLAAYDPRVKTVVSTEGPVDIHEMLHAALGEEQFAAMEQLTVQERVRRAGEGGEAYAPNVVPPGHEGFAYQTGEPKRLLEVDGDHYSIYPWAKGAQLRQGEPSGHGLVRAAPRRVKADRLMRAQPAKGRVPPTPAANFF